MEITGRLVEAERLLEAARAAWAQQPPDVLEARRLAAQANATADEALAGVQRDQEALAPRTQATVASAVATAAGAVDRASATWRHAATGSVAKRGRGSAEAERHLDVAPIPHGTDPTGAMNEARPAEQLAGEAYRLASRDFEDWDIDRPGRRCRAAARRRRLGRQRHRGLDPRRASSAAS